MKAVKTMLCAAAVIAAGVLAAQEVQTFDKAADWGKNPQISEQDGLLTVQGQVFMTGKWFEIDPSKTYTIKWSAKAKDRKGKDTSWVLVAFDLQDKDNRSISCDHVNVVDGTFTEVVADAPKGAKAILVKDGSKFKKGAMSIVKDAKEDLSDLPNRKYVSRSIADIVQKDGAWEITLKAPLNAPVKAGTLVREHGQGGYFYVGGSAQVGDNWVTRSGSVTGTSKKGWSTRAWPVGAVKARLVILSNWAKKDLATQYKDVSVTVK